MLCRTSQELSSKTDTRLSEPPDKKEGHRNMSLAGFMQQFEPPVDALVAAPGGLDKFVAQFSGMTESYWFYDHTIELRFDTKEHVYYLVGPLGELTAQDGVTNVVHIIDKSNALVPWAAKMVAEKLLRTIPTMTRQEPVVTDPTAKDFIQAGSPTYPVAYVPELPLADFTKLVTEAKTAPRDILEEAGDVGHMAHTWLEFFVKATINEFHLEVESKLLNLPADERAASCCHALLGWMKAHNVRWVDAERKVYSKRYQYAGTLDAVAWTDSCTDLACCPEPYTNHLSVVDYKTSNHLYIEYLLQTAAYLQAILEELVEANSGVSGDRLQGALNTPGVVIDRWILRLGKQDAELEPWHLTAEDFQEDLEGFLDALSLTRSVRLVNERMKGQKASIKAIRKEARAVAKAEAKAAEKAVKAEAKEQKKAEKSAAKIQEKADKKAAKEAAKHATENTSVVQGIPPSPAVPSGPGDGAGVPDQVLVEPVDGCRGLKKDIEFPTIELRTITARVTELPIETVQRIAIQLPEAR
jgi:hypothetical protein